MADQPEEAWELTPAVDPWADQDTLAQPGVEPPTLEEPRTPPLPPTTPLAAPPTPPPAAPPRPRWSRRVAARPAPARPTPARPAAAKPAPRRRRRWPRNLLVSGLLSVACCCGVPGYFAWPVAQQYPAAAVLPSAVADLRLHDDAAARRAANRLAEQLLDVNLVADDVFAGDYRDGAGKRVTLFGMTGLRLTPGMDLEAEMRHLAERYELTGVHPFDLGEAGAHERCGVGRAGGDTVVVCGWADHGSLGTAVLTRRSLDESADLVGLLRQAVVTRG